MTIFDTLTEQQKIDLISGNQVGIFNHLFTQSDILYEYNYDLCLGYYMSRSGCKTISPTYKKLLSLQTQENSAEKLLATIIRSKFLPKWNKIYDALLTQQYSVLDSKTLSITKTGNNSENTTYDITDRKTGNNNETETYNLKTENVEQKGQNVIVTRNTEDKDAIYGFNSKIAVDTENSKGNSSETTQADKTLNTTEDEETKTGTLGRDFNVDETNSKTGTDDKNIAINENIITNGRDKTPAELISQELEMRNKYLIFDIIYKDIDSIATLEIYI